MSVVRRSLAYAAAASYFTAALGLLSSIIYSRLLTPREIGIYSVAAVLTALASTLRDFGVGEYLIQERELSPQKIRAALTVNIGISWTLAALLIASSAPVAAFYAEPGIGTVIQIQAISLFLIPFGTIPLAYHRREWNFRPVMVAGVASSVVTFVVGIACALQGMSYLSVAWANLAGVAVNASIAVLSRPAGLPMLPGTRGLRDVMRFGGNASGIYVFGQIGRSGPDIILGRVLDMAAVGFYSRAHGLIEIFSAAVGRPISGIALPYFARSSGSPSQSLAGFLRAQAYMTGVGLPFFACLALLAEPVLLTLYGPQWTPSVPLARIVCAAAAVDLLYLFAKDFLIANGRVDVALRIQIATQCLRIGAIALLGPYGLEATCWGLLGAAILSASFAHGRLAKTTGLRLRQIVEASRGSALVALVAAIPASAWFIAAGRHPLASTIGGVVSGLLCAPLWLLAIRLLRHPLNAEIATVFARLRQSTGART